MKKNILFIFLAFLTIDLYSQIEKGKIIFSIDGNYLKSSTESGVTTNQNITQGKYLNLEGSVGYFLTDRFIVGMGLGYQWGKETRYNELNTNSSVQMDEMNIKSNVLLTSVYLGYYYPIINKLYFSPNLEFSYGKVKSQSTTNIVAVNNVDTSLGSVTTSTDSYEQNSSYEVLISKICPEITYFISSKFSLGLGLGGIEYSMVEWKPDNSSWVVNFNPSYWIFGVKVKI